MAKVEINLRSLLVASHFSITSGCRSPLVMSVYATLLTCSVAFSDDVVREGGDQGVEAILAVSLASIDSIKNVSCTTQDYQSMDDVEFPWTVEKWREGAELSSDGLAMMSEFSFLVDRMTGNVKCIGREYGMPPEGSGQAPYWRKFEAAFDGKVYRTLDPDFNMGQKLLYNDQLRTRRSLHTFLGDGFAGSRITGANLTHWLAIRDGWELASLDKHGNPQLTRDYRTDTWASKMKLHLTLSAAHGYLPSRIETWWYETNTVWEVFQVEEFHRVEPDGIWVPKRGVYQGHYREAVFPDGLTYDEYKKLSDEELAKVDPLITYRARRLQPPRTIIIDPATVVLNQELSESNFVLEFPASSKIYDEQADELLLGGVNPIPPSEMHPIAVAEDSSRWTWLAIANLVFIVALIVVAVVRKGMVTNK